MLDRGLVVQVLHSSTSACLCCRRCPAPEAKSPVRRSGGGHSGGADGAQA
jgi:hypothetical protein